jgi:DNA (cytosine-5)-methyltransferase 1
LNKHWPNVPKYGDIRELTGTELEHVDLIAGGFPCQDVSNAGKRIGITGPRSGLWADYYRIVSVIRPRYVIVENVAGLYVGGGIQRVLGDLASLGMDAEWSCIPAAAFGAPHRRDRVFIVAYAGSKSQFHTRIFTWHSSDISERWSDAEKWGIDRYVTKLGTPPFERFHIEWRERQDQPHILRVVDGIPGGLDRLRGCGNAVVPQVAEYIGRRIIEATA